MIERNYMKKCNCTFGNCEQDDHRHCEHECCNMREENILDNFVEDEELKCQTKN
jgi:hypothetical protein